jgi:UDP-N-acetylmuramoyl-L-alanyl-D-glutamate--2,6-diaminopimelate ligase
VRLEELLRGVEGARISGDTSTPIRGVAYDSRAVEPGYLFAALRGSQRDGQGFVAQALGRGAAAILSSRPPATGGGARPAEAARPTAWVQVADDRRALALVARNYYGRPDERLEMLGVTGTNGKTTVCHLLEAALAEAGRKPCLLGTVSYRYGRDETRAERTTPESLDLMRHLDRFATAGARSCVMEVSSHALALRRVAGIAFRAAVFTNLTQDHLDFHGTMEAYLEAKGLLFRDLAPDAVAALNADDPASARLRALTRARVVTWGEAPAADLKIEACRTALDGIDLTLRPGGALAASGTAPLVLRSPLLGMPNARNLAAAAATGLALGLPREALERGLVAVRGVPGRFERVDDGGPFLVLVDYAHTDDALANLLASVRALKPLRILTVFGCGGDRDRAKRPKMGFAAASGSDVVFVTSDNPRSENPEHILEEILPGVRRAFGLDQGAELPGDRCQVIADRREAIARAVALARPGDAVVIAGKGHETYQILADRTIPFDDRQVAREALRGGGAARGRAACE